MHFLSFEICWKLPHESDAKRKFIECNRCSAAVLGTVIFFRTKTHDGSKSRKIRPKRCENLIIKINFYGPTSSVTRQTIQKDVPENFFQTKVGFVVFLVPVQLIDAQKTKRNDINYENNISGAYRFLLKSSFANGMFSTHRYESRKCLKMF